MNLGFGFPRSNQNESVFLCYFMINCIFLCVRLLGGLCCVFLHSDDGNCSALLGGLKLYAKAKAK